jgi:ubiquitin carboxyl-terminal hydrolase 10
LISTPVELPNIEKEEVHPAEDESKPLQKESESLLAEEKTPETPTTINAHSEDAGSTMPTTPSSAKQSSLPVDGETTPVATRPQRSAIPAVPVLPVIPKSQPKNTPTTTPQKASNGEQPQAQATSQEQTTTTETEGGEVKEPATEEAKATPPPPKAWATPRAWTGLFGSSGAASATSAVNGGQQNGAAGFGKKNAESLAEALRSFNAEAKDSKIAFLEPRGLVNTGNMCYMNSVSKRFLLHGFC